MLTASGSSGQSGLTSAQYSDPATACTSGLADIQGSVSAWTGATASYSGNVCLISSGGSNLGTLRVYSVYWDAAQATPIEYNVVRDDGKVLRYTVQGGVVTAPPGVSMRLAVTSSGFTLTDDQDNVETYNSSGALQSITSRSGIVQTITRDSSGRWAGVTDSFGNSMTVGLNSASQITSVSINGGTAVQFAYDSSSRLTTVTNADSTTHTYGYTNSAFPNALTSEVDENGTTYDTWGYDSQERATSSSLAGGVNAVAVAYNYPNSTTVTDALGAVRMFSFGRFGEAMPVIGISGAPCLKNCADAASTTYDAGGWVSSRTDFNGNVTCYANDQTRGLELVRVEGFASGSSCPANLSSYTPAAGTTQRKITTTWNVTFRLPATITEATKATSFGYDGSGNLLTKTVTDTTITPNVSRTWTYTYNSFGQVLTAKAPRTDLNSTRTYTYYTCTSGAQCGHLQTIADELGHVTTFNTYNAYGQPLTMTDANGVVTTLTYDTRQRLTSRNTAGETSGFSYYPTGLLKTVTRPDSSTVTYTYDGAHRLTQIADGLGNKIQYTLDAMGNRTATKAYDPSNALAYTQTQVFNSLSELYQQIGSAGTSAVTATFGYDANGNQTSINAPLTRNTSNQYDALNRLIQITDPANGVTQFHYDANDNLTSVVDPRSLTTGYTYNGFGDLIRQTSPDTGVTANTYDSAGDFATRTDARGSVATYTYDALNRVTSIQYVLPGYTPSATLSFTYDAGTNGIGHLTGASSDSNHSTSWAYDGLGRVISKSQSITGFATQTVGYAYSHGDLMTLTTPSGQLITYGYNTNHQITSIAVNGAPLLNNVTYEPMGGVNGWTWSNGTSVSRTYDADGNITQISSAGVKSFSYDNAFRITGITDSTVGAASWTYGYDTLDRLTSAVGGGVTKGWTYDANGNRLTESGSSPSTYTLSSTSNQLNSLSGTLNGSYSYDAAGNQLYYPTNKYPTGTPGRASIVYDPRGRPAQFINSTCTETHFYDVLGELVFRGSICGLAPTEYVYTESGYLLGEYGSTGSGLSLLQETVWLADIPVATLRPSGAGGISVFYVHTDQLNTPRQITRPADNLQMWTWFADPFGTALPNTNPQGAGTFSYDLRFPGQVYEPISGLSSNGFRDYDPATGRYVESDPIGLQGGINTYAYVGDSPLQYVDPMGLCKKCGVKKGPEYDHQGTVPQGTQISFSASFRSDGDYDPKCCEVRQFTKWNKSLGNGGPPHRGFAQPEDQPNTWYEDRNADDWRYGHRSGQYHEPTPNNAYGWRSYYGDDNPHANGPIPGFQMQFQLKVIDVCNAGQTIYTSKILTVDFGAGK